MDVGPAEHDALLLVYPVCAELDDPAGMDDTGAQQLAGLWELSVCSECQGFLVCDPELCADRVQHFGADGCFGARDCGFGEPELPGAWDCPCFADLAVLCDASGERGVVDQHDFGPCVGFAGDCCWRDQQPDRRVA